MKIFTGDVRGFLGAFVAPPRQVGVRKPFRARVAEQAAREVGFVAGLGALSEVVGGARAGADVGEPPFQIGVRSAQASRGKAARLELPRVKRAPRKPKLGLDLIPRDRTHAGGTFGTGWP